MSNLVKMGFTNLQDTEKRMIDTNELVARRIEELAQKMTRPENAGFLEDDPNAEGQIDGFSADGFSAGLFAERVEGLLEDNPEGFGDGMEGDVSGNVIKAAPPENTDNMDEAREQLLAETKGAADAFLADAQEKARHESDQLLAQAREQIEAERTEALSQAKEQGYREGFQKGEQEFTAKQKELADREKALEAQYEELIGKLEPDLVDAIGGAYEALIGTELSSYRKLLLHMVSSAMRNIEGGRDFVVHISPEDYPYVSMEKKQLEAALASPSATLELVEDMTLSHNDCIIETEGGIFDCGLGTQMAELKKRLKLLAYEK